ncbi:MAG: hypothetical protein WA130_02280 [Candidatus Methanoperedens sp.]
MRRYNWIGNRIDASDMARLHHLSKQVKKPITILVKEAVNLYLAGEKHE